MTKKIIAHSKITLSSILAPALIIQISLAIGFALTTLVSVAYWFLGDTRFPVENPLLPLSFTILSTILFTLGLTLQRTLPPKESISLRRGAWIVTVAWFIACSTSALFFVTAGFPDPAHPEWYSLIRKFIDGYFESMSGFTTTGSSILPSVEVFPRSVLFWRALTHWIGGMGIAYLAVTVWEHFRSSREAIINSEAESPDIVTFESQEQARHSGFEFLKAYGILTVVMCMLMIVSGSLFRSTPYTHWYDNVYDSVTHTFSVLGTGGFSTYDKSAGLPVHATSDTIVPGGLQNIVSEWIMAFFMLFAGMNFSLWYILFFLRKPKTVLQNRELRAYLGYVFATTALIAIFLFNVHTYPRVEQTLRYAFFNVTSIVSTTGVGNWDFTGWPAPALGVLFVCFLVGGMVGSTAGGPKVSRFLIAYHYLKNQILHFIYGTHTTDDFTIDGNTYTPRKAGIVVASVAIYYLLFLAGAVLLLIFSSVSTLPDGTRAYLDFGTGIAASIANLGNIGPAIAINQYVNAGPAGNYFAFTVAGKAIMIALMYVGRVGVLSCLMLLLRSRGQIDVEENIAEIPFTELNPHLRQ